MAVHASPHDEAELHAAEEHPGDEAELSGAQRARATRSQHASNHEEAQQHPRVDRPNYQLAHDAHWPHDDGAPHDALPASST